MGKSKFTYRKNAEKENGNFIEVKGAKENNLKNVNLSIPMGIMNVVTGVSGSGKSTLINDILYRSIASKLYRTKDKPGKHKELKGN